MSIEIPCNSGYGEKSWVARLTGRNPKMKFDRDFGRRVTTETGIYEATTAEKKGRTGRAYYIVFRTPDGGLDMLHSAETLVEDVIAAVGFDGCDRLAPGKNDEGVWVLRHPDRSIRVAADGNPREEALAAIRKLMAEHGISAADLEA